MDIFKNDEKELLIKQIEQTMVNHPISVSNIMDWILVAGLASDYGYKPIDLIRMNEERKEKVNN